MRQIENEWGGGSVSAKYKIISLIWVLAAVKEKKEKRVAEREEAVAVEVLG